MDVVHPRRSRGAARLVRAQHGVFLALFAVVWLAFAGCGGGGRGPSSVAKEFLDRVAALDISSTTAARGALVAMLSASSRAVIEARAAAAKESLKAELGVADVVRFLGYSRGDRVARMELLAADDDKATFAVTYVDAVVDGGTNEEPVKLELVREEDGWKVVLPLAAASIDAAPGTEPSR